MAKQLMELFGDILPFLEDSGLATRAKMKEILGNAQSKGKLMLELAITIDAGQPFVEMTYKLEGDGPLALSCYEEIVKLTETIHFPNLTRTANDVSGGQELPMISQVDKLFMLNSMYSMLGLVFNLGLTIL